MAGEESGSESAQSRSNPSANTRLAEYAALRAEVDRRAGTQWSVFALQVASAGAIGSFALSFKSNVELLLLIPLSSYVPNSRYILHDYHIKLIHEYIRTCLFPRLNDVLQWEGWKAAASARDTARASGSPSRDGIPLIQPASRSSAWRHLRCSPHSQMASTCGVQGDQMVGS